MTVTSSTSRANYVGTGTVGPFAYGFRITAATDLLVTKRNVTTGIETTLSYPGDYSVSGVGNRSGGAVTLTQVLASGDTVSIRRAVPFLQESSFRGQGTFRPDTHEDAFDHGVMLAQQNQDALDRSITLSETYDPASYNLTLPAPVASKALVWNVAGTGLDNATLSAAQLSAWSAANNIREDVFVVTTHFTAGVTTVLTLSATPGNAANVEIIRTTSGSPVTYTSDQYSIVGTTLTFTSAIPASTTRVQVRYLLTYQVNTVDSANATWNAAGTGALARSVRDKLRDDVHVDDYCLGGGADDALGLQRAVTAAAGGRLLFGDGATYLTSVEIVGLSDMEFVGNDATIGLHGTTRIRSFFYFAAKTNVTFTGLNFNLGKTAVAAYAAPDYPTIYNVAVHAGTGCEDFTFIDCTFSNLYTVALWFYQVDGFVHIEGCEYASPAQTQTLNLQHIQFTSCDCTVTIADCDFDDVDSGPDSGTCHIYASGTTNPFTIRDCRSNYGGRDITGTHALAAFAFYLDSVNVLIKDCTFTNVLCKAIRFSNVGHAEVKGCQFGSAATAEINTQLISIESVFNVGTQQGCQDIKIHHNTFVEAYDTTRIGIVVASYDYARAATDILIHDNLFTAFQTPVNIAGPYSNVRVFHNSIRGANGGIVSVLVEPGGVPVTGTNGVTEAQSAYDNLFIDDNTFDLVMTGAAPISVSYVKAPAYTGTIGQVTIDDNTIRSSTASVAAAISLRGTTASAQGRVRVRRNDVTRYASIIDVANFALVEIADGTSTTISGTRILNSGGIGSLTTKGNKFGTGAMEGYAQLTAGTVTIATDEVRLAADATYHIIVSRIGLGGTPGILAVGVVVDGVSMVINSLKTDATIQTLDTSFFFWRIEH